jgi:hypothetical protein
LPSIASLNFHDPTQSIVCALELIATAGVGYSSSYSFESFIQLTFGSFFFLFYSSSLLLFVPYFGYYSFIQLVLSTNLLVIPSCPVCCLLSAIPECDVASATFYFFLLRAAAVAITKLILPASPKSSADLGSCCMQDHYLRNSTSLPPPATIHSQVDRRDHKRRYNSVISSELRQALRPITPGA